MKAKAKENKTENIARRQRNSWTSDLRKRKSFRRISDSSDSVQCDEPDEDSEGKEVCNCVGSGEN